MYKNFLLFTLIALSGFLFADEEPMNTADLSNEIKETTTVTEVVAAKTYFQDSIKERMDLAEERIANLEEITTYKKIGIKTLPNRMNDDSSFACFVDFLYWRAQNPSFIYANRVVLPHREIGIRMPYAFKPGFRVGLGYNSTYDGWDVYAIYTRHHSHVKQTRHTASTSRTGILPVMITSDPSHGYFYVNDLFGAAKLRYDTADFQISRDFFISKALTLKPYFSVSLEILKQHLDALYDNPVLRYPFLSVYPKFPVRFCGKLGSWGLGPKIGLSSNWMFYKCFGLFVDGSMSLLYGKTKSGWAFYDPTSEYPYGYNRYNFYSLLPNLNVLGGMKFQHFFCNGMYLAISAAYEANYLWERYFAEIPAKTQYDYVPKASYPFGLQGLTLRTEFRY